MRPFPSLWIHHLSFWGERQVLWHLSAATMSSGTKQLVQHQCLFIFLIIWPLDTFCNYRNPGTRAAQLPRPFRMCSQSVAYFSYLVLWPNGHINAAVCEWRPQKKYQRCDMFRVIVSTYSEPWRTQIWMRSRRCRRAYKTEIFFREVVEERRSNAVLTQKNVSKI